MIPAMIDPKSKPHNYYGCPILIYPVLNPFPNKPWFLRVCRTSLLKTPREKEKLLMMSNFSFSHCVFSPFRELLPFSSIWNCRLQTILVCKREKFVVWERVNRHTSIVSPSMLQVIVFIYFYGFKANNKHFVQNQFLYVFSSPEHNMLKGELLGWWCVRRASCVINNFFKHLLSNPWANLDQTWQECSFGGPLQKLFTEFDSIKNSGCHGNEIEFF